MDGERLPSGQTQRDLSPHSTPAASLSLFQQVHNHTVAAAAGKGNRQLWGKEGCASLKEKVGEGERQQVTQSEFKREIQGNRMTSGGKEGARDIWTK